MLSKKSACCRFSLRVLEKANYTPEFRPRLVLPLRSCSETSADHRLLTGNDSANREQTPIPSRRLRSLQKRVSTRHCSSWVFLNRETITGSYNSITSWFVVTEVADLARDNSRLSL